MLIRVNCPNPSCGRRYKIDNSLVGRAVVCQQCRRQFTVAAPAKDVAATVPLVAATMFADLRKKIGRYEVRALLGGGAFGTVYRCFDPEQDREVAIKVLRRAARRDPRAVARFEREAKTAKELSHPHIVPVFEYAREGELYYIVSEYIAGRTLDDLIEQQRPDFRRAVEIVSDLADALAYAHHQGVTHRDVKPSNVLLNGDGEVFLTDFGLARVETPEELFAFLSGTEAGEAEMPDGPETPASAGSTAPGTAAAKLTQMGAALGTPSYMPPEQAAGNLAEVGPASDQYSLGVVLYELLCGDVPFSGPPELVVSLVKGQEPVPPPRSINLEIPEELERICLRATAKRPKDRYPTCRQMADDLQRWLAGRPVHTRRPVASRPQNKKGQPSGGAAAALAGMLTLGREKLGWFNTRQRKIMGAAGGIAFLVAMAGLASLRLVLSNPERAPHVAEKASIEPDEPDVGAPIRNFDPANSGGGANEGAVTTALVWLAEHQLYDGSWSLQDFQSRCMAGDNSCTGKGKVPADAGATALGLLPFLAAGQTHKSKGPYREHVLKGVQWLMDHQGADGNLAKGSAQITDSHGPATTANEYRLAGPQASRQEQMMYSHGLATIALSEAFGLSGDEQVGRAAQGGVNFILAAQNTTDGGWRYNPRDPGDTSVVGWQLMALKSAHMADLNVGGSVFSGISKWLDSVAVKDGTEYSYQRGLPSSYSMTAEGLLCRQYLGAKRDNPMLVGGMAYMLAHLPDEAFPNVYYWYYATQVMHKMGGYEGDLWNTIMRKLLVKTQVRNVDQCANGSWDPANDMWGRYGGRLMTTSLSCLTMEVNYGYLPLFEDRDKVASWQKMRAPAVVGDVEVTVFNATRGAPPEGAKTKETDVLTVEVRLNLKGGATEKEVDLTSWMVNRFQYRVSLEDDHERSYSLLDQVAGDKGSDGRTITKKWMKVLLVFSQPDEKVNLLKLKLPAAAFQPYGPMLGFEISSADIRFNPARSVKADKTEKATKSDEGEK